jgi:hypothetical protein
MAQEVEHPNERTTVKSVEYGGHLGDYMTVNSTNDVPLKCFSCGDDSLYHDAHAWWNPLEDDLLCDDCVALKIINAPINRTGKLSFQPGYYKVLTQH